MSLDIYIVSHPINGYNSACDINGQFSLLSIHLQLKQEVILFINLIYKNKNSS